MRISPRVLVIVSALLITATIFAGSAQAETREGERVVIAADEVVTDDLYVAAEEVIIDGTVEGDVLGMSRVFTVNGTVTGDLMVGAQAVTINGVVGDDARIGCQALTLNGGARIGDDTSVAAFSMDARPESSIGGNVWLGAYQGLFSGTVEGDITGGSNGLDIEGQVGGNVNMELGEDANAGGFSSQQFSQFMPEPPDGVSVPDVRGGLTVGPNASVAGNLDYSSVSAGRIDPKASTGSVTYHELTWDDQSQAPSASKAFVSGLIDQVRRLIRLMLVGMLMVWLIPGWLDRARQSLAEHPWPSLGWGALSPIALGILLFAALIVLLLLAFALSFLLGASTIVSALLASLAGTVTLAYLLLAFYVAALIAGYALAQMLFAKIQTGEQANRFVVMAAAVVVVWIATAVPVLGTLVGLILALFGLGAAWLALRQHLRMSTNTPVLAD